MNEWISGTSGLQLSIFRRSLLCLPVKLQEEENLSFFILDYSSDKVFNTFNEANIVSFINERKRSVVDWCDSFFVFICFYSRLLQTDYQIIEKIEKPQIH